MEKNPEPGGETIPEKDKPTPHRPPPPGGPFSPDKTTDPDPPSTDLVATSTLAFGAGLIVGLLAACCLGRCNRMSSC